MSLYRSSSARDGSRGTVTGFTPSAASAAGHGAGPEMMGLVWRRACSRSRMARRLFTALSVRLSWRAISASAAVPTSSSSAGVHFLNWSEAWAMPRARRFCQTVPKVRPVRAATSASGRVPSSALVPSPFENGRISRVTRQDVTQMMDLMPKLDQERSHPVRDVMVEQKGH
jgi:hypothetical protein